MIECAYHIPMRCLSALLFVLLLWPAPTRAAEPGDAPVTTSLTMYNDAALSPGFTHYPYVNPDAPKGGALRQAALGTFDNLNPFTLKGKPPMGLGPGPSLVFDRLTDRSWDEPFTLYPLIAEKWRVARDRSAITFYLNPRAQFHDGTAITADDVVFTWEVLRDQGRPNMRRVYQLVDRATVADSRTISFTLKPGYDRETVMILAMMPVLSRASFVNRLFDAATQEPILGSGPYRVAAVEPGRRIVYERVANYWAADLGARRGQNNFDQIIYEYFRDDSVAFQALTSGALDFRRETDLRQWQTAYDIPRVRSGDLQKSFIPHGRAEVVRGFMMNTRRPPFYQIEVRRAVALALDFDWINRNFFGSQLQRTNSIFPNTDLAAPAPTTAPLPARAALQQADALLKQAGFIVKDGIRVNAQTGAPLRFDVFLGAAGDEKIALAYARSLKKLGITMRVRTLDAAAFRDRLNTYNFDMVYYFWQSTLSPGGEQTLYWGCAAAEQPGRFNYPGLCDPKIDRAAMAIAQTTTRPELMKRTSDLDSLVMAAQIIVPMGYLPTDLIALDEHIARPGTTPLYGVVPESWWAVHEK